MHIWNVRSIPNLKKRTAKLRASHMQNATSSYPLSDKSTIGFPTTQPSPVSL